MAKQVVDETSLIRSSLAMRSSVDRIVSSAVSIIFTILCCSASGGDD